MKKLLFISFLFVSLSSFSQGNLQFNKVINLNYTGEGVYLGKKTLANVTIPDGKVWKITYVYAQYADDGKNYIPYKDGNYIDYHVEIGGIWFPNGTQGNGGSAPTNSLNGSAVWIDSGLTEINIVTYENDTPPYNVSISAIEFNVVQ